MLLTLHFAYFFVFNFYIQNLRQPVVQEGLMVSDDVAREVTFVQPVRS